MASILRVDALQKPDGNAPNAHDLGITGSVVQVQHVTHTVVSATYTNEAPTMVATGYYIDFTPTKAGNKLIIQSTGNYQHTGTAGGSVVEIRRDGILINGHDTEGTSGYGYIDYDSAASNEHNTITMVVGDYAQSTSPHRYEIYVGKYQGTDVRVRNWGAITFVIWEVEV